MHNRMNVFLNENLYFHIHTAIVFVLNVLFIDFVAMNPVLSQSFFTTFVRACVGCGCIGAGTNEFLDSNVLHPQILAILPQLLIPNANFFRF